MAVKNISKKIVSVDTKLLKNEGNLIDIDGDISSYNVLKESIKTDGFLEPILIDENRKIIDGHRRLKVAEELDLQTISAIIIYENMSDKKIKKLKCVLHQSSRKQSYIDEIELLLCQNEVHDGEVVFSKHMAEILNCTHRSVETKVKDAKLFRLKDDKTKEFIFSLNRNHKLDDDANKSLISFNDEEINTLQEKIETAQELDKKQIKTFINEIISASNKVKRHEKINKNIEKITKSSDEKISEASLNEIDDIFDSNEDEEQVYFKDFKKLLQYEIKQHFNIELDDADKKSALELQSVYTTNFKEEIELIISLLNK